MKQSPHFSRHFEKMSISYLTTGRGVATKFLKYDFIHVLNVVETADKQPINL